MKEEKYKVIYRILRNTPASKNLKVFSNLTYLLVSTLIDWEFCFITSILLYFKFLNFDFLSNIFAIVKSKE